MNSHDGGDVTETATDRDAVSIGSDRAASIHVEGITKQFETGDGIEPVFEDVSVDIDAGSFVTLLGQSGSGKSTMLKIISGVIEPTSGTIQFDPEDVTLGYVFQSPRLLPWNTCVENIEFVHEGDDDYSEEVAATALDLVGLSEHYDKYPNQLSGGQRQRVGIARALSIDPDVLLMDEPFSNLDEITAEQLREELLDIWQQLDKTIFFVTHDITEAIELSDRILMLGEGRIYADISVTLDRPRSVDSEEFLQFRQAAIETFHGG